MLSAFLSHLIFSNMQKGAVLHSSSASCWGSSPSQQARWGWSQGTLAAPTSVQFHNWDGERRRLESHRDVSSPLCFFLMPCWFRPGRRLVGCVRLLRLRLRLQGAVSIYRTTDGPRVNEDRVHSSRLSIQRWARVWLLFAGGGWEGNARRRACN